LKSKIKIGLVAFGLICLISIFSVVIDERRSFNTTLKNDNEFQLKSAAGRWADPISIPVGDAPWGTSIGDANNDGYNDIVNTNFWDHNISIHLWNPSLGEWSPQIKKPVGTRPASAVIGDANNDGYNDIVTANPLSHDLSIILWNSTTEDWDPQIRITTGDVPQFGVIEDANNDGYNDLVTILPNSDQVAIVLWNPSANDWILPIYRTIGDESSSLFVGDANNDGYNDIVTADGYPDTVSFLLFNPVSGDWDPVITRPVGLRPEAVFVADVNNDGYNDVVTANAHTEDVSILIWNSVAADWDPEIRLPLGSDYHNYSHIFVGDANNDGYNDIVTANERGHDITLLLWNPYKNNWDGYYRIYLGGGPIGMFIGDANNDGYNDLVVGNAGADRIDILLWVPPSLSVDIVDQSFSTIEFTLTLHIYNEIGQGIDSAEIQMCWNGIDVSADVLNLSNGLYFISLEPITVILGEEPILLNMTISVDGYEDTYFETDIAVFKFLNVEITEHSYSLDHFNFTFFIFNEAEQGINSAIIQMWWNGSDVSSDVVNLGNGFYFASLETITVIPGEDPILLDMIILVDGYQDKHFEIYIAVDPDTLVKDGEDHAEEFPLAIVIIVVASVAGGLGGVTIALLRKRRQISK
jgi:hypothetical protein